MRQPLATLEEIAGELKRRTGIEAHRQTIPKVLREASLEQRRDGSGICVEGAAPGGARYGYTDAHRRLEPEQTYANCLTHAEWALVEDLFDNGGRRGTLPATSAGGCLVLRGAHRLCVALAAPRAFRPGRTSTGHFALE